MNIEQFSEGRLRLLWKYLIPSMTFSTAGALIYFLLNREEVESMKSDIEMQI
jgi:hypothetical protein